MSLREHVGITWPVKGVCVKVVLANHAYSAGLLDQGWEVVVIVVPDVPVFSDR